MAAGAAGLAATYSAYAPSAGAEHGITRCITRYITAPHVSTTPEKLMTREIHGRSIRENLSQRFLRALDKIQMIDGGTP